MVERALWTDAQAAVAELPEITRKLGEATETISTLTIERDETKTELERVQGLERAATARVQELESEPTRKPPVRVPEAVERTFGAENKQHDQQAEQLKAELNELTRGKPSTDPSEGQRRSGRITQIKRELRIMGVEL